MPPNMFFATLLGLLATVPVARVTYPSAMRDFDHGCPSPISPPEVGPAGKVLGIDKDGAGLGFDIGGPLTS